MGAVSTGSTGTQERDYQVLDAGVYVGRCIQVVELGTFEKEFQGEKKNVKEVMIVWELAELMEDGRPFTVNCRITNSLSEKAKLYKMLTSWRGKKFEPQELSRFELKTILDKGCMINVTKTLAKNGKEYNNVDSVMPVPKGMSVPDRVNALVDFGIGDRNTDEWELVWPWVQRIINSSQELSGKTVGENLPF